MSKCYDSNGLRPAPKSLYLPDDPVWAYFNIPAPQDAPPLPDLSHLDPELDAPLEPIEPRRNVIGKVKLITKLD